MSENARGLRKVSKVHEVTWKKPQWEENAVCFERAEPRPLGWGRPAPATQAASPRTSLPSLRASLPSRRRVTLREGIPPRFACAGEGAAGVAGQQSPAQTTSGTVHSQDVRAAGCFDLILFEGFLAP